MIIKSYRDDQFELILNQSDNNYYSVILLKNNKEAEYQGNIKDLDTAMQVYDYLWDRMTSTDLSQWNGVIE